jgi:hypothetical protein
MVGVDLNPNCHVILEGSHPAVVIDGNGKIFSSLLFMFVDYLGFSEEKPGLEYDFETVHNIDIWGCELAPTTKQGLRSWNMTVQYWLATYVHRRVPLSLKPYR